VLQDLNLIIQVQVLVAEQDLMQEVQLQVHLIGMTPIQQNTLTHKLVVKVEQVDNFQTSLDMEQETKTILANQHHPQATLEAVAEVEV
jgi:hypothetical protein